jgi:hypothetical protein
LPCTLSCASAGAAIVNAKPPAAATRRNNCADRPRGFTHSRIFNAPSPRIPDANPSVTLLDAKDVKRTTSRYGLSPRLVPRLVHSLDSRRRCFPARLRIGCCHRCEQPLRMDIPVHRVGDCAGRSPGSRVVVLRPAFPVSQWPSNGRRTRRSQLRGQPWIGRVFVETPFHVPFCFPVWGTSTQKYLPGGVAESSDAAASPLWKCAVPMQRGRPCGQPLLCQRFAASEYARRQMRPAGLTFFTITRVL